MTVMMIMIMVKMLIMKTVTKMMAINKSYLSVGMEQALSMTYPFSEGVCS